MKNPGHVKRIVLAAGGNTRIGMAAGITHTAVSKWIEQGYVPIERVPLIEALSGIPRHEIRPDRHDLFPPPKRRQRAA